MSDPTAEQRLAAAEARAQEAEQRLQEVEADYAVLREKKDKLDEDYRRAFEAVRELERERPALHSAWLRDMEERLLGEEAADAAARNLHGHPPEWDEITDTVRRDYFEEAREVIQAALTTLHTEEPNHEA